MVDDFEKPVIEAENELMRVRGLVEAGDHSKANEVERLERRLDKLRADIYGNLTAYQRVLLSRHTDRPFTLDYVSLLIKDFAELHGDRLFGDDPSIVGGIGRLHGRSVMVVGHQRGRTTQERIHRNFGMSRPEGNRKALRLYKLAEKFGLPLLLFIDTPGAFPGIEAEERGQSESIARNILVLSGLRTPIISIVIGEGGSGGALALGVCDRLLMLENSTYSVISAEACASIIWGKTEGAKVADYAKVAAESLKLTVKHLSETGLLDEVVKEPTGGAHRDHGQAAEFVGASIERHLAEITTLPIDELLQRRYEKFRQIGKV